MMRGVLVALSVALAAPASAQNFSCRFGTRPACLDFGDTVCSSMGRCVNTNAVCFDSFQCDFEGFTCRSNVTACIAERDDLRRRHNNLVIDYNDLLGRHNDLVRNHNRLLTQHDNLVRDHDDLRRRHNNLVSDYNDLLEESQRAQSEAEDAERCVQRATTLAQARLCF